MHDLKNNIEKRLVNMGEMLELSFVVPVYNVEDYLPECLDSILNQDINNFEIICVEDCSTDNSMKILEEYAVSHEEIRVIRHEKNRGLSASRNTGIENARGRYIQFIDSDDVLCKNASSTLWHIANTYNTDSVFFDIKKFTCRYDTDDTWRFFSEVLDVKTGQDFFCDGCNKGVLKIESVRQFLKREFLINNNIRFYEGIIHEDELFFFNVVIKAGRVIDFPVQLYYYRQRPGSIMNSQKEKSSTSLFVIISNIYSFWLLNNLPDEVDKCMTKYLEWLFREYKYSRFYQSENTFCGGYKERVMFNVINTTSFNNCLFSDDDEKMLMSKRRCIIYGAGRTACDVFYAIERMGVKIENIAVSSTERNPSCFGGKRVCNILDLEDLKEVPVVIGVGKSYLAEIMDTLKRNGFFNIIIPVCKN